MTEANTVQRTEQLDALFRAQQHALWSLAYRLTGTSMDAEEAVQEAFVRLLTRPPSAPVEELGRWLARVVTNLSLDALRRRRRSHYSGPWLPSPVRSTEDSALEQLASKAPDPEQRYGTGESATFAFLLALEALSPRQRAVLLLRDVLGWSSQEVAERLCSTEGAVRVLHLRARRALAAYDSERCIPTADAVARHRQTLQRFLDCLRGHDAVGLESLLADSVTTLTDSAGEYTALRTPLVGCGRVARLYLTASRHRQRSGTRGEILVVNGLPAALITLERPQRRQAPRTLLRLDLDEAGRIRTIHALLARAKLAALLA